MSAGRLSTTDSGKFAEMGKKTLNLRLNTGFMLFSFIRRCVLVLETWYLQSYRCTKTWKEILYSHLLLENTCYLKIHAHEIMIFFLDYEEAFTQNQIKSLLLSHHHSTSALVSEILMSVLQTVQKTTDNLHMDRQCKKNNRQFTYGQTVQKNNRQFTYGQTVQKNNRQFTYGQTVQKKQQTIYIWTDSAKNCTGAFTVLQTVQKNNNSNLHMDSTYLQTVQKTMCKIHIHILSTHSVL